MTPARTARIHRTTAETDVRLTLNLDGEGRAETATGIGFLDHLLDTLARHACFDLDLTCRGDLEVDDHHTAEDCALALGQALDEALGERRGIARFGSAFAPLDEALARAVVDLSGRGRGVAELALTGDRIGALSCQMVPHLITSLASTARAAIHVDVLRGSNDHHRAEAAFKALALALREAVGLTGSDRIPSTKEILT
jgi:imidazoleglycerol-phosphate dehydratase